MEDYLELPAIVEQQNPDTYQYDNNSKPYRFTRLYLNNYDANIGKDKEPTGEEDKPMWYFSWHWYNRKNWGKIKWNIII